MQTFPVIVSIAHHTEERTVTKIMVHDLLVDSARSGTTLHEPVDDFEVRKLAQAQTK